MRAYCWLVRVIGSTVPGVLDFVAEDGLWKQMNLSDGMEVKVVVFEAEPPKQLTPQEFIKDKCDAARHVLSEYDDESAMGYLIGEKFLNFLEVAEKDQEWRAAIPEFVTGIRSIFEGWRLAQFLETPRRLGTLGHVADEDAHRMFRQEMESEEILREDARNLRLFEWAKPNSAIS